MIYNKFDANHDIQITKQLFLATQLFEKVGDRIFTNYGLTIKTHEILLLIEGGSNTTTKLADAMNLALAGITQKTKILEKNGFISRKLSTNDLRMWHFEVTPTGKDALKAATPAYEKAAGMLYSDFSESDKKQIMGFLSRISNHLSSISEKQLKDYVAALTTE